MRCIEILQTALARELKGIHLRQQQAVWRAVAGLIQGGQLWLTAIGRSLAGASMPKHGIKSMDRLLGNRKLHRDLDRYYRALAVRVLRRVERPIIAVDWTSMGAHHYQLSANVCWDGRALPVYSHVVEKKLCGNAVVLRRFLHGLAGVVPCSCKPVFVTDAGFHHAWFAEVAALDWDFVGRVRSRARIYFDGRWRTISALHRRATSRPRDLGQVLLPRSDPHPYRLVLAARPKLRGRHRLTRRGTPGRRSTDIKCAKAAREPWLLATSLLSHPKVVVEAYSLRMQIEQTYRDFKNHRHGWSMPLVGSRTAVRLAVLALIAALANIALHLVGRAASLLDLARTFQANTCRTRRVFSFFTLGRLTLRAGCQIGIDLLRRALVQLNADIRQVGPRAG